MAQKRGLDAGSTASPLPKRMRLALRICEALFQDNSSPPRTYGPLGILGPLLDGELQEEDEPPQDEDESCRKAYKFSEVSKTILQDRLGFHFSSLHDWTPQRLFCNVSSSKHYADDLEPLYNELETIYSTAEPDNLNVVTRQVTNAYLSFAFANIRKNRETDIKNAIKTRLEADPNLDVLSLMPTLGRGRGLPSTFSELSVEDKANYIGWCNRNVMRQGILDIEGVKDTSHIRLFPEFNIDSGDKDASYRDRNDQEITLSGVVENAMLVFKTQDEEKVRNASSKFWHEHLHKAKSLEARLLFLKVGGEQDPFDPKPLMEASAQALALNTQFKRPNVRFVVTNSQDQWIIAHLYNPLDGGSPEVTSCPLQHGLFPSIPFYGHHGTKQGQAEAEQTWRYYVRAFYVTLLEWLLPESASAIPNPPQHEKSGSNI
ncbi:uncharacterized protein ARMOST_07327 [Armillaria ostoyae]|uniref:Uncharacterized protein n=1 Tax=Armillaria ostoyae TaxID=47428 RepID=A0A284R5H4_ARMOS|nr:uncharacterized protein ARMOST_07327 [Armillaria ostoyae]